MRMLTVLIALIYAILLLLGMAAVHAARHATMAPIPGTPAPVFTLNAQDGKPLSLGDFRGHWVVLYFYPKDFTSGCTKEARNFQQDLARYEQRNAVILGVSGQDQVSHEKFCAAEGLGFKLLGVARLSARHTFLIDPAGVIRKVYLKVDPARHSAEVLADLSDLQKPLPQT